MEAVVSEVFVLRQLKKAIEIRETWLEENNLPMNFQMRDGLERHHFLQWAKGLFHAEDSQQTRQAEGLSVGGKKLARNRMYSRWNRKLKRRLGTGVLWYMVTFTGRFDATFLQAGDDPIPIVAPKQDPNK